MSNVVEPPLDSLLVLGRTPRRLEDGIWSCLPVDDAGARYDGRAAMYDRVIGSAVYNCLVWGARTADYRRFAAEAIASSDGLLLDAGCGSCVFTADAYRTTSRRVVLVDRSIGMLRAARARLGPGRPNVLLLQADLFDLPFRPAAFSTVLSMGMLHLFDDVAVLARHLARVLMPAGQCFATSLVDDRPFGRFVLRRLQRAGEVAAARSTDAVRYALSTAFANVHADRGGSMAYFRASLARPWANRLAAGDGVTSHPRASFPA